MKKWTFLERFSLEQRAALITVGGLGISRVVFYATQILLMVLFVPAEIGLIAVVMAALAFSNAVSAMGVDAAIISRSKVSGGLLTAAWIIDFGRGTLLTLIFGFLGPSIGRYLLPESQLEDLLPVAGLVFFIFSFRNIGVVCLRKELQFEKLIVMDIVMMIVNCATTIVLAVIYESVWAIVAGHLAGAISYVILSYVVHDFRFYRFYPKGHFLEVISFSKWVMIDAQINAFLEHGMVFFTASRLGSSQVAYLDRSDMLTRKTSLQIGELLWRVGMPIFSRSSNDLSLLREKYLKALFLLSISSAILMAMIYLIFSNYSEDVFGPEWAELSKVIPLFALVGWLSTMSVVNSVYYQAVGIPKVGVKYSLIRLIATGICFFPLVDLFGIQGVVMSLLVGLSITMLFVFEDVRSRIQTSRVMIYGQVAVGTIPAIVMILLFPTSSTGLWIVDIGTSTVIALLSMLILYSKIKFALKL